MTPPKWLNEIAVAEWRRVAKKGHDPSILAAYCQSYARWVLAEQALEQHGTEVVLRDDKGVVRSVVVSPQVGISNKSLDRMLKCAPLLGLTANLAKPSASVAATTGEAAGAAFFGAIQ